MSRHRYPKFLLSGSVVLLAVLIVPWVGAAADVLTQFNVTKTAAETGIFDTVWHGSPAYFGGATRTFKALSADARAAAVTAAAAFARTYVQSDVFRARYARQREQSRPQAPAPPRSWKEQQAEQKQQFEKSVAEMKANLEKATPEVRKIMEQTIETLTAQQAAQEKNAALQAQMEKAIVQQGIHQQQDYERRLKEFEETYPVDANRLVAARLRGFIELAASVPADAELVEKYGKLRFADPKLEGKSYFWKQCYRAGKPTVDAARVAAEAWLKELAP